MLSHAGDALRASSTVLSMWSHTVKLDEKDLNFVGLAQEIGFFWTFWAGWHKGVATLLCICKKKSVINMI